jgi:tetratricopeptide (TPR) repeat protein
MSALTRTIAVTALLIASQRAAASDFWDEVRSPGLAAHRAQLVHAAEALSRNRASAALHHAEAAIAAQPERAAGHALRGRALLALARHGEATAAFEQALARDPRALDDDAGAEAAAQSALYVGRPDLTLRVANRWLAQTRDARARGRALLMLADALQLSGPSDLRRAVAAYREALIDSAHEQRALLGLALALHRSGEGDEAIALARRAGEKPGPTALPPHELAARTALWLSAIGDRAAAGEAWARAAEGGHVWSEHARAAHAASRNEAAP